MIDVICTPAHEQGVGKMLVSTKSGAGAKDDTVIRQARWVTLNLPFKGQ